MKKIFFALVVLSISLTFGPEVRASYIFYDGFEYTDSPLNHGWTMPDQPGSTSDHRSFAGQRSLYLGSHSNVRHSMNEISASLVDRISVYYYDDMFSGGNWDIFMAVQFDDFNEALTMGWYNSPNYIWYTASGGTNIESNVERSLGWHHFEWVIENNQVSGFIDNEEVVSEITVSNISGISLSVGSEPPYGYFDEVKVEPIPEPSTMLLLSSGLFGLAGLRKKFLKR